MASEFKVGDSVRLKSGGPTMTVNEIDANENVFCQWFAGRKVQSHHFNPDTLVHAEEED